MLKSNKRGIAGMPVKMKTTTESRKPTLLCIDDNQTVLRLRKMVLESAGYSVLVANDSAAAMHSSPRLRSIWL